MSSSSAQAHAYAAALKAGPAELRAFLEGFPKGSDLHMHLSGSVDAETFIRGAGEDRLCIDTRELERRFRTLEARF